MFIVKQPIQKNYPNFNYMLTCSTVTYVNFKERCYVSYTPKNAIELDILRKNGFEPVDGAIADLVMRFNCVPGCSTKYCCSGHPGNYTKAYIYFESIPDEYASRLDSCKYWYKDSDQLVWRNCTKYSKKKVDIPDKTDFTAWMKALMELNELKGLPENTFTLYQFSSLICHNKHDGSDEEYVVLSRYGSAISTKERLEWHDFVRKAPIGRTDY